MREFTLAVFLLVSLQVKAQLISNDVFASAGTTFSTASTIINFTIGEPINQTFTQPSSNIIVTQGFHQPEKQNTTINIFHQYKIKVFPNPTFQWVYIYLGDLGNQDFTIELFDELGRILFSNQFYGSGAQLDISSFSNAIYHLRILFTNKYPAQYHTIIKQNNQ